MPHRLAIASLAWALAACGGGPETTTSDGVVKNIAFKKPVAIFNTKNIYILRDQLAVLVSDDPDACAHLAFDGDQERPYLLLSDGSHAPSLWMRMTDHSDVVNDMRGVGEDLHASFDPGAAAGDPCGLSSCQSLWIAAEKGTADINSSQDPSQTDSKAKGDYSLVFSGQQISGTFDAQSCPNLKVSGCSAAGTGALVPGLSLLALALLKRRRA